MINDRTTYLDLPLPHVDNALDEDVGRLRSALVSLDSTVNNKAAASHGHAISGVVGLQTALDGKQAALGFTPVNAASVGANNGIAPLDSGGKVAAAYLPSFVDDVLEAANFAALPGTGETGKIYVTLDVNKTWRWSGSAYIEISASPGSSDVVGEGSVNLYFTASRVLGVLLSGLSTATNAVITTADSILGALGKLQKQITDTRRDAYIISGGFFGWAMTPSGGTETQPALLTYINGTDQIRAAITWGTTGGEAGNATQVVYAFSSNSGSSWTTVKTKAITYTSGGSVAGATWS